MQLFYPVSTVNKVNFYNYSLPNAFSMLQRKRKWILALPVKNSARIDIAKVRLNFMHSCYLAPKHNAIGGGRWVFSSFFRSFFWFLHLQYHAFSGFFFKFFFISAVVSMFSFF